MVKEFIQGAQGVITWANVITALTVAGALVTFAIQLGTVQTHVLINTDELALQRSEHKAMLNMLSSLTAEQKEQDRRLDTIERKIENNRVK